jgi:hypothetical protein
MAVVSAPSAPKALPRHVALAMIDHAIRNNQTCAITHEPITHDRMYYVTNCCGQVFDSNALRHWIIQNVRHVMVNYLELNSPKILRCLELKSYRCTHDVVNQHFLSFP